MYCMTLGERIKMLRLASDKIEAVAKIFYESPSYLMGWDIDI